MEIEQVVEELEAIAPLSLAGSWDNIGLLLEGDRPVERVLLTIDLSEEVAAEAIEAKVDLIVSYHPPIFRGLKRLTGGVSHGPALLSLLRNGVHVYSPHTALDATEGGINDWLLSMFSGVEGVRPITPDPLRPEVGAGRIASITSTPLGDLVPVVKSHLGLQHLRVAGDAQQTISRVAVCPGNGTSLFAELRPADGVDLVLTGEMSHHDVIHHVEGGRSVIISEHSHTERGYLPVYADRIRAAASGLQVSVSTTDTDPLRTV